VQFEHTAGLKWIPEAEQSNTYFRFNRDVLLRTDAKSRAEYMNIKIMSGQMSPNEGRELEDLSSYPGGDFHYMPANMLTVEAEGRPTTTP
jgi:phage portal protein BeeE